MNFSFLGGRTFSLVVSICIALILMRWFEHLDNNSFTLIMLGIPGAFIAKSTVERHTEIRADVQKTIAAAQSESAPPSVVEQVRS